MTTGMRQLMEGRSMPVDRLEIGLRWRHLHIVFCRHIECAIAADPEVNASRLDELFDPRLDQAWRRRRSHRCDLWRQALALIDVEYRKALEECDGLRFLTVLARAPLFVHRHKAIGIDDGRAALALANVTAERKRLTECKPALTCERAFGGSSPEDQNVDAAILAAGRGILRQGQLRLRRRGAPRLHPWHSARLKFADDLVGDFVIKVCPVLTGTRSRKMSGHRGLRDGRCEPLSQPVIRHGKTQPALLLSGSVRV